MKFYNKIFSGILVATVLFSCSENDLEPTTITTKPVEEYTSISDARSTIRGALDKMTESDYYGRDYIIFGEVYADNAIANGSSGRFVDIYRGKLIDQNRYVSDTWKRVYELISTSNLVINKKLDVADNDRAEYEHLVGEAYFLRALGHFDLLRYYGQQNVDGGGMSSLGIPYETEFRPEGENLYRKRNTVAENVKMISEDLGKALAMMKPANDYNSNYYVNSDAAKALKVRVALYFKDYETVLKYANEIINSGKYSVPAGVDYKKAWANTSETPITADWIFALANTTVDNLSINGLSQIYQDTGYGDVEARGLVSTLFGENDIRGLKKGEGMIKSINGLRNYGKYPHNAPSNYSIPLFRYEEVLMSKAEALYYKGGNMTEALAIFNDINTKRGAEELTTLDKDVIVEQWRKEFYFEGFRFHTLARNGMLIDVPEVPKNIPYGNYQFAFPIPNSEMNRNYNMVQNKGY